jgi:hypothetical protein
MSVTVVSVRSATLPLTRLGKSSSSSGNCKVLAQ